MAFSDGLTSIVTVLRNAPVRTDSGAWIDTYSAAKTGVKCRISQPPQNRAVVGEADVSDQRSPLLFLPDEDIKHGDRITVTGGKPQQLIGASWDVFSPTIPAVPIYLSATGRRIVAP